MFLLVTFIYFNRFVISIVRGKVTHFCPNYRHFALIISIVYESKNTKHAWRHRAYEESSYGWWHPVKSQFLLNDCAKTVQTERIKLAFLRRDAHLRIVHGASHRPPASFGCIESELMKTSDEVERMKTQGMTNHRVQLATSMAVLGGSITDCNALLWLVHRPDVECEPIRMATRKCPYLISDCRYALLRCLA